MVKKLKRQSGFSIIEFLIAITLVGIIVSMAVPAFIGMVDTYQTDGQQRKLLSSLKFAQSEAVKRGQAVSVCVFGTATTCAANGSWEDGWHIFVDVDGNQVIDAGIDAVTNQPIEPVLRSESSVSSLRIVHDGGQRAYTFNQTGQAIFGAGNDVRMCTKKDDNTDCGSIDSYHNTFNVFGSGQIVVL